MNDGYENSLESIQMMQNLEELHKEAAREREASGK